MENADHNEFIDYMSEIEKGVEKEVLKLNRIQADRDNEAFKLEGKELKYSELDFDSDL